MHMLTYQQYLRSRTSMPRSYSLTYADVCGRMHAYADVCSTCDRARRCLAPLRAASPYTRRCSGTACVQHTSAYVSIRQHASYTACVNYVTFKIQQTSACVRIRQHTPIPVFWLHACVSIRQNMSACASIRQNASAYVSIRQHTSAYVSIRQHTSE
jgi:non-ribosomal peptide synthetase component E (peptide arylation enzyme)